ncbi:MAG: hypothetical protein FWG71_03535 [Synergistaceae bacterium]|nr:hypothetical protein [Synergistaceae bacterium]
MTPTQVFFAAVLILAVLFYFKRRAGDDDSAPAMKAEPNADIKARHVAAVTAAILAATNGRGRILNIAPAYRANIYDATQRWRSAAIIASVGRRLPPSWKR